MTLKRSKKGEKNWCITIQDFAMKENRSNSLIWDVKTSVSKLKNMTWLHANENKPVVREKLIVLKSEKSFSVKREWDSEQTGGIGNR